MRKDDRSHGPGARLLRLALAAMLVAGCYNVRRVPLGAAPLDRQFRRGDQLRIERLDGSEVHLRVSGVTASEILGEPLPAQPGSPPPGGASSDEGEMVERPVAPTAPAGLMVVPVADVAGIERTRISRGRTAAAIAGWSVGGTYLLITIAAWITSGSPVINSMDGTFPARPRP